MAKKISKKKLPSATVPRTNKKKDEEFLSEELDLSREGAVHDVTPRDVYGAPTGKRYEYQYEQAAKACIELLEDQENLCVFCEWHDDFVIEKKGGAVAKVLYAFNQVKTRQGSEGPWLLPEMFGANKKKSSQISTLAKSHIFKLLRHFVDFGKSCERIVFLTNASLHNEVSDFLKDISEKDSHELLSEPHSSYFKSVFNGYSKLLSNLDEATLFALFKKLEVVAEDTPLKKSALIYRTELMDKIMAFSEIDLRQSESVTIGDELLKLVRTKAHHELQTKVSDTNLRSIKGIELGEVLDLLSLSKSAYSALAEGDEPNAIKKLSRLHRLLRKSDPSISDESVRDFCELKVNWEVWQRKVRHGSDSMSDLIVLKNEARDLLRQWLKDTVTIREIPDHAENIANRFAGSFRSEDALNKDLVFGCILSLAVEGD